MNRLVADGAVLRRRTRADGAVLLSSSVALPAERPDILERLRFWAATKPGDPLLTQPGADGRREVLSYSSALREARVLRAVLAARGLGKGDVVASLLPAGIDALVLRIACLAGGHVHVTLPPFPFRSVPFGVEARNLLDVARPALIVGGPGGPQPEGPWTTVPIADLRWSAQGLAAPDDEPAQADDPCAIFFTSGSTGSPKGVPITRGMIASNQAAIAALWPFVAETPPVLVDWLPWHHVFGGLDNLFKVIWNGGTLHVDVAPSAATIDATVALMADVAPTMHITVPLGLRLLLDRLEADGDSEAAMTRRLQAVFFAGAGIDAALWGRLQALRERNGGFAVLSGYGATEAASTICLTGGPLDRPGELGIPLPGHEIALMERDGRTELCVSGPNIAPCYLAPEGRVDLPADDFGFYRTGDAAVAGRRGDGQESLFFDGRLAEDFKLSSGVKVRTGPLRAGLLAACAPLAQDLVVAGENADFLVALVFPAGEAGTAGALAGRLAAWNRRSPGSSTSIRRFAIADFQPDRERGELSDKGQIVQTRFLRNHAALFEAIRSGQAGFDV